MSHSPTTATWHTSSTTQHSLGGAEEPTWRWDGAFVYVTFKRPDKNRSTTDQPPAKYDPSTDQVQPEVASTSPQVRPKFAPSSPTCRVNGKGRLHNKGIDRTVRFY